ncbi:Npun_F5749 family FMN-dependent PPOX-type flavoprotein [Synechocystis sp. PCC 7509]|uniref:Npun_F5749 family FMN-dependent PPOX-type flavoprotein n=1 Tax=Synechocystis sp. PCC 7509 TaxID=927677 RepID=UPI0002AC4864|nr:FMN-dependent protein [Synechocystis sp. PCC 7509]
MFDSNWRVLLEKSLDCHRNITYARYLQLATVTTENRPANRTVVFRGFYGDKDCLKFTIDSRSEKVRQIAVQPWAEACWYFTETREQFRFSGLLHLVQVDNADMALQQARQACWQELSDNARLQFAWANPGQPRTKDSNFNPPAPNPVEPLANFCLLLLEPIQVDYLNLLGNPQNRYIYRRKDGWVVDEVNP